MNWRGLWVLVLALGLGALLCRGLDPGDRYVLMRFNSANGVGRIYYHNGLWAGRIPLGDGYEFDLSSADLSPDGLRVAFNRRGFLYVYDLETGKLVSLNPEPILRANDADIEWSADGEQIGLACTPVREEAQEICAFDTVMGRLRVLTDSRGLGDKALSSWGSWSGDGQSIVFLRSFLEGGSGATADSLQILDVSSHRVTTVLAEGASGLIIQRHPALSPDGKTILFGAHPSDESEYSNSIYRVNADGTGLRRVAAVSGSNLSHPVWSPDGRSFYVFGSDSTAFGAMHFNLDGERVPGLLFQDGRALLSWRNV